MSARGLFKSILSRKRKREREGEGEGFIGTRVGYVDLSWVEVGHQRTCLGGRGDRGCMQPVVLSQVTPHEQIQSLFIFLDTLDTLGHGMDTGYFVAVFQKNITNTEGTFWIENKKRKIDT